MNGKRHGEGKFAFATHEYGGGFTDDQALGQGSFTFDNGAVQKGSFVVDGAADADAEDEDAQPAFAWVGDELTMKA